MTTHLPELPETLAWHVIEAKHSKGVTYWLVLVDSLWTTIDQHGWRTGYVPSPEQLAGRARKMMSEHSILRA